MTTQGYKSTIMFPGQGSQFKGMGKELFAEYRDLTDRASALLGYSVSELCLEDPRNLLSSTQYTQPALYVVNALSYLRYSESDGDCPDYFMGHSLGEYNALLAAEAFDFLTGLKLVRQRGELMASATEGGMCAVLGMTVDKIQEVLLANPGIDLCIANYNSPFQTVLSGNRNHIEQAKSIFENAGAKACVKLNVAGAFHSEKMNRAREDFARFLTDIEFSTLKTTVISNVTALPYETDNIAETLAAQIVEPVKWYQGIDYLLAREVGAFIEVGPGKVLGKLVADINRMIPAQQGRVKVTKYEGNEKPLSGQEALKTEIATNKMAGGPEPIPCVDQKREFTNPDLKIKFDNIKTLRELVEAIGENRYPLPAFTQKQRHSQSLTYGELKSRVEALGTALLVQGVKKGDRIGLVAENRLEWPLCYLAVACVGAVIVPIDIFLSQEELNEVVRESGVTRCFCSKLYLDRLVQVAEGLNSLQQFICLDEHTVPSARDESAQVTHFKQLLLQGEQEIKSGSRLYSLSRPEQDDPLALIYMTKNQFAELSHQGVMANLFGTLDVLCEGGKYLLPGEKSLICLPFHHTFPTMGGFLLPLARNLEVFISQRFSAKQFVNLVQEESIHYAVVVPFMLEAVNRELDKNKISLDSIKFIFTGGASVRRSLLEAMLRKGCNVVQGFGLTEFSPIATVNSPRRNRLGSIGRPIAGVETRIVNPDPQGHGELLLRGPSVMKGYLGRVAETASVMDGAWLRTGDIAYQDADGYLYISGRSKPIVVNSGGKNIYLGEVEALLKQDACIADIKVFPYLDPKDGECPAAVIYPDYKALETVARNTGRDTAELDLVEFFRTRFDEITADVASYKIPRHLHIAARDGSLPENSAVLPDHNKPFMFIDYYLNGAPTGADIPEDATTDADHARKPKSGWSFSNQRKTIEQFIQQEINQLFSIEERTGILPSLDDIDSISQLTLKFNIEQKLGVKVPMALLAGAGDHKGLIENIVGDSRFAAIRESILALKKNDTRESVEKPAGADTQLFFRFLKGEIDLESLSGPTLDKIYQFLTENIGQLARQ